jgi:hypothetical protein
MRQLPKIILDDLMNREVKEDGTGFVSKPEDYDCPWCGAKDDESHQEGCLGAPV